MVSRGERRLGREGFGGGWTDGLLLLADHRPPGPRASVPDGRGHRWLQHPPHAHHAGGHVPLLLHQLPLGLQPPPAAPQARVRGQNELPSSRRAGEGTACRRAGTRGGLCPGRRVGGKELLSREDGDSRGGREEMKSPPVVFQPCVQEAGLARSRDGGSVLVQILFFLHWLGDFDSHSQQPQSILAGPFQPVWTFGWSICTW